MRPLAADKPFPKHKNVKRIDKIRRREAATATEDRSSATSVNNRNEEICRREAATATDDPSYPASVNNRTE